FQVTGFFGLQALEAEVAGEHVIVGMKVFGPKIRIGGPFLAWVAEQAFGLLADKAKPEIHWRRFPNHAVDRVDEAFESLLLNAQGGFDARAFCDFELKLLRALVDAPFQIV